MVGSTLLHYRIVRALGSGGMGEVYAAEDTKLHRMVAVKILPAATAGDPERLARFRREAQAIAALNHPHVVTIYSVEESGGTHFLTMELVEGKTLAELVPPQGLSLKEFLKIAVPLTDAVSSAHAQGVVHRDLKPSNVMVSTAGRVKVLDFGLAKLRLETLGGVTQSAVSTDRLTAPHHVFGTPAYMSPEQAEGREVDHRTDIFSVGILLYEMATGRRPFTGESPMTVISSIIKDTPPLVTELRPDLPADLDRILRRCLAKEPARRFQTALDLKTELEDLPLTASASGAPAAAPRRGRVAAQLIAVGVAAVTITALVIGWKTFSRRQSSAVSVAHPEFKQLTSAPAAELFPSLSPDGGWVVYAGEGAGNRDIYLQSTTGQRPLNLTEDSPADDEQPAFSPDGESIVFRSSRDGGGIFVMGRTGEAVRRVTREGFNPAWSPDGKSIAYTTGRMELRPQNSEGRSELWVVGADGEQPRKLYDGDATLPNWSPSGQRIAFSQRGANDQRRITIATIAAAGGPSQIVPTGTTDIDWNPVWSPDGRLIYYGSNRGGSMNLWRVAVDEASGAARGEPEPITTPAPFVAHIAIARDGKRLAYSSILETQNIQRLPFDPEKGEAAGPPINVTTGTRLWSSPDPSPDGQWVVFYSHFQPEGDLYVIKADGSGAGFRQLTNDEAIDRVPRWSPDGNWIAFFSNRASERLHVWKIHRDGSGLQQVETGVRETGIVAWSPDGSRMAASGADDSTGPGTGQVVLLVDPHQPLAAQTPTRLPAPPPERFFIPNSWSPDGRAVAGQNGFARQGVAVYSVHSQNHVRLTDFGEWPVWLPDSRRILFVARLGREFHVLDSVTRQTRMVFSVPRDTLGPPRLTRDGRAAYFSRRVTEGDIWLVNLQ